MAASLPPAVRPQKRSWLYGGLAHPSGVLLVQPKAPVRKRLPPGSTLLLAGDAHAWGISPFIGQLCQDTGVTLRKDLFPAPIETWAESGRLGERVSEIHPHMVIVSLLSSAPPEELQGAIAELAEQARSDGATFVWLRPPHKEAAAALRPLLDEAKIPSFHSEALEIAGGEQPTVRGYAGWAGALWRWIG